MFSLYYYGGETGIRTLDTVTRMPHFECGPFDLSGISPFFGAKIVQIAHKSKTYFAFRKLFLPLSC